MKSVKTISTLSFVLALQAGVPMTSAAILTPSEVVTQVRGWSPKIKPGPKPGPGGDKRPKPPIQPCHPRLRICRGGI